MNFGYILHELIEHSGTTQKQLADHLELSVHTLKNYINDSREPSYKTLKLIAEYFGVSIDYLLDHHCRQTSVHCEDRILRIFGALSFEGQSLMIEIAKVILKCDKKQPLSR